MCFFFKQKTAYDVRISDWSSDVCSSDLRIRRAWRLLHFSGQYMSFADLGLSEELLRAVNEAGYDKPTPIQTQAIPQVLMMKDLIGIAQTGTGKTARFRSEERRVGKECVSTCRSR